MAAPSAGRRRDRRRARAAEPAVRVESVRAAPRSRVEEHDVEPPYTVRLRGPLLPRADTTVRPTRWRRDGHAAARRPDRRDRQRARRPRTSTSSCDRSTRWCSAARCIVLLDLAIVGALWLASVIADGGAGRWLRARRRTLGPQLSRAALARALRVLRHSGGWRSRSGRTDSWPRTRRSRAPCSCGETLRVARAAARARSPGSPAESDRLDTPLFLLPRRRAAADERPALRRPGADRAASRRRESSRRSPSTPRKPPPRSSRSATPRRCSAIGRSTASAFAAGRHRRAGARRRAPLGRRRRDLGVLVLFATAVGALAALWLSGVAARQLAQADRRAARSGARRSPAAVARRRSSPSRRSSSSPCSPRSAGWPPI